MSYKDSGYNQYLENPISVNNTEQSSQDYDSNVQDGSVNSSKVRTISFDKAKGGTLTLGGQGNSNGLFSLLNSSGKEKISMNNEGMTINDGSITIADSKNSTVLDANGLSTNNFPFDNYNATGNFAVSTNSWAWIDITGSSLTFSLVKSARVLIMMYATMWCGSLTYNSSYVRVATVVDGSVEGYVSTQNYDYDKAGIITSSPTNSAQYVKTLNSGSHTIKLQASTDGTTTSGIVANRGLTYLVLGN